MISSLTERKLSTNHYVTDDREPHIILIADPDRQALLKLVNACPAGLYRLHEDGSLNFDPHGCLECGTCRLLCGNEVIARWRYPTAGSGIILRFG